MRYARVAMTALGAVAGQALAWQVAGGPAELVRSVGVHAPSQSVQLTVDVLGFDALRGGTVLRSVELSPGERFDLAVEPVEVVTPGTVGAVVAGAEGEVPLDLSALSMVRGHLAGQPESLVYLAVSPWGVHGVVQSEEGRRWSISSGPYDAAAPIGHAFSTDTRNLGVGEGFACGVEAGGLFDLPIGLDGAAAAGDGESGSEAPCKVARIAVDTEWELTRDFSNNPQAAAAYSLSLMGAVSEIYDRELTVRLTVPYLRVWSSNVDPYDSGTDAGALLNQFRDHWSSQMGGVQRELAHVLSPKVGGGVAWVGVLCNTGFGYGASGIDLFFPYPIQDFQNGNWDLMVVAHELGHNFGTLHTHDGYTPPIDNCGNGDCTGAFGGTIMSYCHLCPPSGVGNISLTFPQRVRDVINGYLAQTCPISGDETLVGRGETARTIQGTAIEIDVLANEISKTCLSDLALDSASPSAAGGVVEVLAGSGFDGRDIVRYTPPTGYSGTDTFTYTISGGGSTTVAMTTVVVDAARPADNPVSIQPGVDVKWYDLPDGIGFLPPFDLLPVSSTSTASQINFLPTGGVLGDSGFADTFGARMTGYIDVPTEGLWTLSTVSDDGSALYVGSTKVVDNDFLHGMVEASGVIALAAGKHAVRVEFFENGGTAGLIARWSGPGVPSTVIPASAWFRDAPCAADLTGEGDVNTNDFFEFLALYQAQDPRADFAPGGGINTNDFFAFLAAYQTGC